ncbi:hypothetical protein CYQ50_11460 [Enterococcus faecalis]|uniref:hypothetical protein n=1 Tax=Enterococcus faecalis TaxID=1351 RepID=UPI001010553A|nr:hypothetical protein [Enterococcus faecalis]MCU2247808.1 hypothetical protein [Enterococcus faecalis]RXU92638.1 hypothetical protein CYQ50_11460 [Enterococcus faecalis]
MENNKLNKKKENVPKISLILLGTLAVLAVFISFNYEQKMHYNLDDVKELEPFNLKNKPFSNEKGELIFNFEKSSQINSTKDKKIEYFIYNTKTETYTELKAKDNDKSLEYVVDLKDIAQNKIKEYQNNGVQFHFDYSRFRFLLENELKNERLYLIAFPRNHISLDDLNNSKDIKFADENSFETIYIDFNLNNTKNYKGGYRTLSEYVSSLVTQDLSAEDFVELVKNVRSHVPKTVEIIDASIEKGTVSKKLGLYCLSKGNYDYLKTTYVLKDDSKISVSSKYLEYLKSYNIDKNEQVLFRDDIIADLNQKILQDKEKYENDLNKVFLDVNFQKLGVADALFAFRDDDDGSGWLELSVVK